jgi:hypothetical protein
MHLCTHVLADDPSPMRRGCAVLADGVHMPTANRRRVLSQGVGKTEIKPQLGSYFKIHKSLTN